MSHTVVILFCTLTAAAQAECQRANPQPIETKAITFPKHGLQISVQAHIERIVSVFESDMGLATYLYFEETFNNTDINNYASLEGINLQKTIFNPQTIVHNAKSKPTILSEETTGTPEGIITRKIHLALTTFCPMDFHKYPFDTQHCEIDIQSFAYGASQVNYKWANDEQLDNIISTASSTLKFVGMRRWEGNVTIRNATFSCLKITLEFRRDLQYYLYQNMIPSFMMVAASWSVLWIDQNCMAERISVVITIVLTLSTSATSANYNAPSTPYTKAMEVFTGTCLTFLFVGIGENILVLLMRRKRKLEKTTGFYIAPEEVDRKARVIFPATLIGYTAVYFAYYSTIA